MNQIPREAVQDFTDSDLQAVFAEVEDLDVVSLRSEEAEFLRELAFPANTRGIKLPWAKTEEHVRLRSQEVSVWAGINGHKKSTILSQVAVYAAAQGFTVGIQSYELTMPETGAIMCAQAAGNDSPSEQFGRQFLDWAESRVWFYRLFGSVTPLQCIGATVAMAKRGCKLIVIDNLQFTQVTDDSVKERLFFNQLIGIAKALKVHIAVVHHVRKPERGGDEYVPTKFDVKGSGTITDQAHTTMIVWHNKLRATARRKQQNGFPLTERELTELEQGCDQKLIVAKQRKAPFEGMFGLYDSPGRTFKASQSARKWEIDI